MFPGVACQTLERPRKVDDRRNFFVITVHRCQFVRLLERLLERHSNFERHLLGNAIDESIGLPKHPSRVADNSLCRHRAEGNDLGDSIATVALGDVFDDTIPAFHTKVDIEIGHRHTLGVQKSLKQQNMFQRIQVRDSEYPGHE